MNRPRTLTAELVTIGDELLLGSTVDTNASFIAGRLREAGFDLQRKTTVGDRVEAIAEVTRQAAARADLVLTTGGLGPTADDPTRQALAQAAGLSLEYRPELWEQVQAAFARFGAKPSENNRQQAYLPAGAAAIPNPVGTAPAFRIDTPRGAVIALPGVPREMRSLLEAAVLPWLFERFGLAGVIRVRVLRTAGVGESRIDERIRDLESLGNPDVGLAAHAGQVDVRITARAADAATAASLLAPVEAEIRERLGRWIFGADAQSLAGVTLSPLASRGWQLTSLELGTGGKLAGALATTAEAEAVLDGCLLLPGALSQDALAEQLARRRAEAGVEAALGISLAQEPEGPSGHLVFQCLDREWRRTIAHGGHPDLAAERMVSYGLELARLKLLETAF